MIGTEYKFRSKLLFILSLVGTLNNGSFLNKRVRVLRMATHTYTQRQTVGGVGRVFRSCPHCRSELDPTLPTLVIF